ncbi:hypothetical protein [Streptomyces luteogriseus]|uniref:hypothetical protein n=1 Tax=Streptomyces luteogriseus TaxID=68233 RepID=UPI0027D7F055|nr:hypothetical protein [Streptomyces luteogriseus]
MTTSTDYRTWKSPALLEAVRSLAVSVTAGNVDQVPDLAEADSCPSPGGSPRP